MGPFQHLTDDFIGGIAGERESRRFGVDLHGSSQSLLCSVRHAEEKQTSRLQLRGFHKFGKNFHHAPSERNALQRWYPNRRWSLPVSFIQNYDFVPPFWQRHLLLCEHLDFVPDNVNSSENGRQFNVACSSCEHNAALVTLFG